MLRNMEINSLEAKLASTESLRSYLDPEVYANLREKLLIELVTVYKRSHNPPEHNVGKPQGLLIDAQIQVKHSATHVNIGPSVTLTQGRVVGREVVFDLPKDVYL
jgi:hypothetical protein